MHEHNWALAEKGARLVEVSSEATHISSSAANILVDRDELLWITGDAPQHVTLKLADSHPPLCYVGWHVWHDYLTNPKTVEVASGESLDEMTAQVVCQAVPGAGTQIWKLPCPIPSHHLYLRLKIVETFGPGPTYLNNVVLFAEDPGSRFRTLRQEERDRAAVDPRNMSSGRVSGLLRELDEDIRLLHPIKAVASKKNMLLYLPKESEATVRPQDDGDATSRISLPQTGKGSPRYDQGSSRHHTQGSVSQRLQDLGTSVNGCVDIPSNFNERLCALEQAVASLTQTMNHQREDLSMIKRLLLQQAAERRRELDRQRNTNTAPSSNHPHAVSRHQVSVDFPEQALRSFVEDVVGPRLHKHAKRTEAHTLATLDGFLKEVVAEMTQSVDERVRFHIQRSSCNNSFSTGCMGSSTADNFKMCSPHVSVGCTDGSKVSGATDCSFPPPHIYAAGPLASSTTNPHTTDAPVLVTRDTSFDTDKAGVRNSVYRSQ
uniref:Uncharacterized protein n=1 Tax=Trypanosoma congolense (strain IL3000) TaxID=1068625 RepID=G0UZI4_TRYCI|nr:conserved hypothetical protein [Trypanosoma congolense IL3000]